MNKMGISKKIQLLIILKRNIFYIENLKKAVLLMLGKSYESISKQFSNEQEIMYGYSDMLIHLYATESLVLRLKTTRINKRTSDMHL